MEAMSESEVRMRCCLKKRGLTDLTKFGFSVNKAKQESLINWEYDTSPPSEEELATISIEAIKAEKEEMLETERARCKQEIEESVAHETLCDRLLKRLFAQASLDYAAAKAAEIEEEPVLKQLDAELAQMRNQ